MSASRPAPRVLRARRRLLALVAFLGVASCNEKAETVAAASSFVAAAPAGPQPATSSPASNAPMSLYDLSVNTLEGEPQPLSIYKGKVALVVNVASECGYTPQYQGLERLYEAYKDKGFVLLGFPSNDFGGQEPGDGKQIRAFCSTKFHVTFPMFEKVMTKAAGRSPVYALLSEKNGEPKWNFHKFLVGKDGKVLAAFSSAVEPDSATLKEAIEDALAR